MAKVQNEAKAAAKEKGSISNDKVGFFQSMRFQTSVFSYCTGSYDNSEFYVTCTGIPEDFNF